jgi:transposase
LFFLVVRRIFNTTKTGRTVHDKADNNVLIQLTDQLAWYRRKFWKASSEKYIPSDPAQRKIDFDGLEILPEEEAVVEEAQKEVISYERKKPERKKKQPVRLPLPEDLRREVEVIEPDGIDDNWIRIGEEVTEVLEHKPGEFYVRRIVRPKYALKKDQQQHSEKNGQKNVKIATLPLLPLPRSNVNRTKAQNAKKLDMKISKFVRSLLFSSSSSSV